MAEYTEYTTTTQLQPKVMSQAPTIVTQRVTPIIQNKTKIPLQPQIVYTSVQPEIVNQPQQQFAYMPVQQQPQVQNSNDFTRTIAQKYVTHLENQTQQQASTQGNLLDGGTIGQLKNEINANAERQLFDIYQGRQNTEAEKQKELEELRKFKERVDNEKKEAIINKQVEEKTEKKMSDLEDQQNQINDTVEALESVDTSAFSDPNALRNYLNDIDNISDIKKFRSLIEEEYGNLKKENEKNKEKNGSYLKTLEDQLSKNQQEITSKQTELNRHQSSKSFIKKIIEWISGSKDKKGQELKERLAELRKEVEGNMADIKKQREVLKEILLDGAQIMQKETEEMKKIDSENMKRLFNRREQFKKIEESKEIKQDYQTSLINTIRGNTSNIRDLTAIRDRIFNERNSKWSEIYPKKDVNNNNSKIMSLNSINDQKKKSNSRGW